MDTDLRTGIPCCLEVYITLLSFYERSTFVVFLLTKQHLKIFTKAKSDNKVQCALQQTISEAARTESSKTGRPGSFPGN